MEIIIGIAGLLIAWLTYKKTFLSEPKEEKEHLLAQFLATQKISNQTKKNLIEFATANNAFDKELFPEVTYQSYITKMETSYNENLSDELFEKLKKMKLSKSNILSMTKSLERQFEALLQINTQVELHLKRQS
ncbi:MAG TPA: hypothetical protein VFN30_02950 [Chitinophagaceae bacterium]|nr:hypothetical protein [Chitinophagaceae bacterium]